MDLQNPKLDYYEDTNTGFYRLQRNIFGEQQQTDYNFTHHNHNYDQIYGTNHPGEMMMAVQGKYKLNKMYRSEETDDFNISYINNNNNTMNNDADSDFPAGYTESFSNNEFRYYNNQNYYSLSHNVDSSSDNNNNKNTNAKKPPINPKYKSMSIDMDDSESRQQSQEKIIRRSYSNSKLDSIKWKNNLLSQNHYQQQYLNSRMMDAWPSNIQNMTEFELKR